MMVLARGEGCLRSGCTEKWSAGHRAEWYLEGDMTTQAPTLLYMLEEDLYRFGNATTSKLNNVRDDDVDVFEHAGLKFVRANGKAFH